MVAVRQGKRIGWEQVPPGVRAEVERVAGVPVVATTERIGGFSPGAALRLDLAGGRRAFLKTVSRSLSEAAYDLYRAEIDVNRWLPDTGITPRLTWSHDDGEWVALLFDYVDAETPPLPWQPADLELLRTAVATVHAVPCPPEAPPVSVTLGDDFTSWSTLAATGGAGLDDWSRRYADRLASVESGWVEAAAGDALLHTDLRHDNVLVDGRRAWIVDWPWATRGAPWVDVMLLAPAVARHGGPPVAELLSRWVPGVPRDALAAVGAGLAGFFTLNGTYPPPPALPYLRQHQTELGVVTRAWLADLLGWH